MGKGDFNHQITSTINPPNQKFNGRLPEILSGASRSLLMKIIGLLTAYLFAFVVARYFGAETWGEFSLALSIILFGATVGTGGMDMAIVKITASLTDKKSISFSYTPALISVSILSFGASVLIFFLSEWIAGTLFNNPGLTSVFELAAFAVFPLSVINLNTGALQGLEKINKYVFIRFVSRHIIALLLLLILMLVWAQNQVVLIAYIIGLYLIAVLSFYWLMREKIHPFRYSNQSKKEAVDYSRLLKLSVPLMFAGSLVFLNGWIDTIMVGAFMTEQDVGVYNIALKISGLLLLVLTSVNVVITPKFSKMYHHKKMDDLKEMIRYSTSLIFYCTLPLFLVLILFPEQVLSIFGEEFMQGKHALMILCGGSLFSAIAGSVGYFMQMTDSQVAFQNITLASSLLGLILNFIFIPAYGIEGAALATFISTLTWNAAGVGFIKFKYGIDTYYRPFLKWRKK